MKYLLILFIFSLYSTHLTAQFYPKKKVYEIWEGDKKYWEKIYKYPVRLDSAYYSSGQLLYAKKILDNKGTFKKFYPDGDLHVIGSEVSVRKGKLDPKSGEWKVYHSNQQVKKEVNFRNGMRWGVYREYDRRGNLLKEKEHQQKFAYGFNIGVLMGNIDATTSNDTLVSSDSGYGWEVGFLLDYNLSNRLSIRTMPTESFQEYELNFNTPQGKESLTVDFLIIKLPISITYKVFNNLNVLAGMSYNFKVLGENDREVNDEIFSTKTVDLGYEIGVFYEIKFSKFVAAPELRYSPQISNWADGSQAEYSEPIEKMHRNQLTFTIAFKSSRPGD